MELSFYFIRFLCMCLGAQVSISMEVKGQFSVAFFLHYPPCPQRLSLFCSSLVGWAAVPGTHLSHLFHAGIANSHCLMILCGFWGLNSGPSLVWQTLYWLSLQPPSFVLCFNKAGLQIFVLIKLAFWCGTISSIKIVIKIIWHTKLAEIQGHLLISLNKVCHRHIWL